MNKIKTVTDHLYNVYLRDGVHWMRESEVNRRFGKSFIDDHFAEHVDHSEWCECRDHLFTDDPFATGVVSEPPF